MSLVNKMLHDLEDRQVVLAASNNGVIGDLQPSKEQFFRSHSRAYRFPGILSTVPVILLIYLCYVVYMYANNSLFLTTGDAMPVAGVDDPAGVSTDIAESDEPGIGPGNAIHITEKLSGGIELKLSDLGLIHNNRDTTTTIDSEIFTGIDSPALFGPENELPGFESLSTDQEAGTAWSGFSGTEPDAADQYRSESPAGLSVRKVTKADREVATTDRFFKEGIVAYRSGDVTGAIDLLYRAVMERQSNTGARELLVSILLTEGDKQGAEKLLLEGLNHTPGNISFIKLYAKLLFDNEKPDIALNYLNQARPALADDPEYYALLAAIQQGRKNYLQAAQIYQNLVKVNPGNGIWWMGLGICMEAIDRGGDAVIAYKRAAQDVSMPAELARYLTSRLNSLGS